MLTPEDGPKYGAYDGSYWGVPEPEVWILMVARPYYHLIVKHPHDSCFDVVKVGATGVTFIEELSALPEGAVRLVEDEQLKDGGPDEAP